MAAVTERIAEGTYGGAEMWVDLTYDVPDDLDWDNLTEADEPRCSLISLRAVNETSVPWTFNLRKRNGQAVIDRTLGAGADISDTAPFPGGTRDLSDLLSFSYGPVV